MYNKLRSTSIGLFAALTFAAATALVGEPVPATAGLGAASVNGSDAPPARVPLDTPATTRKRQSVRVNLAMPYYSFGRLLPRRES